MNTHRKLNDFSTQNYKIQGYSGVFRYLEEICEILIKFDAFSAKIGAKIAKFQ